MQPHAGACARLNVTTCFTLVFMPKRNANQRSATAHKKLLQEVQASCTAGDRSHEAARSGAHTPPIGQALDRLSKNVASRVELRPRSGPVRFVRRAPQVANRPAQ